MVIIINYCELILSFLDPFRLLYWLSHHFLSPNISSRVKHHSNSSNQKVILLFLNQVFHVTQIHQCPNKIIGSKYEHYFILHGCSSNNIFNPIINWIFLLILQTEVSVGKHILVPLVSYCALPNISWVYNPTCNWWDQKTLDLLCIYIFCATWRLPYFYPLTVDM